MGIHRDESDLLMIEFALLNIMENQKALKTRSASVPGMSVLSLKNLYFFVPKTCKIHEKVPGKIFQKFLITNYLTQPHHFSGILELK